MEIWSLPDSDSGPTRPEPVRCIVCEHPLKGSSRQYRLCPAHLKKVPADARPLVAKRWQILHKWGFWSGTGTVIFWILQIFIFPIMSISGISQIYYGVLIGGGVIIPTVLAGMYFAYKRTWRKWIFGFQLNLDERGSSSI